MPASHVPSSVMKPAARPTKRIEAIDLARGCALLAMAIYHFAWDLEFFGYAEPGMTSQGGWKFFARVIASSFLFLVGVSLYLAHGHGIRWRGFARRLAMVAGAALMISAATYVATPDQFIFFGILHQIALASLLGLAFLHLPPALTLAGGALVALTPWIARSHWFAHPVLWWIGLAPADPPSNDYVPLFPWTGAVLAGVAAARFAAGAGWLSWLSDLRPGSWTRPLREAGRHSLAVYLLHQPLLIGVIWLYASIAPPTAIAPKEAAIAACQDQCQQQYGGDFCLRYCNCVIDRLELSTAIEDDGAGQGSEQSQAEIEDAVRQCSAAASIAR